ncbi:MAG: hypothetical protein AB1810_15050 [Pseudomonadota bacterium]
MRILLLAFSAILALQVAACSPKTEEPQNTPTKMSDDNAFKGYGDAVDKAKGVEQTVQDQAEEREEKSDDY